MKNTCLKVVTFGVYDMFHFGHLRLFRNIKKQFGEESFLTVCVQSSDFILKYKPESKIFYSTEERVEMIKNIRCVDEVKIYENIFPDITEVEFDVWVKGPDQEHKGFQDAIKWCNENNKEVFIMPRTEGISSSYIKTMVQDLEK